MSVKTLFKLMDGLIYHDNKGVVEGEGALDRALGRVKGHA